MREERQDKFLLAIDIGYSNFKSKFGYAGAPASQHTELILPAGTGPASKLPTKLTSVSKSEDDFIHVIVDGEPWVAGVPVDHLEGWGRDLHEDYPSTKNYKAMFLASLALTKKDKIDKLITGLPVSQALEFEKRDRLIQMMKGVHEVLPGKFVEVVEVEVLPQPIGAYLDLYYSADEDLLDIMEEGLVVVVDPGFFSVDWVSMKSFSVRKESSGTSHKAMSKVLEVCAKLINASLGDDGACTKEKVEHAIRSGKDYVLIYGQKVETKAFLKKAAVEVAPQSMSLLKQSMRDDEKAADIILIPGGGSEIYREAISQVFPKSRVIVPENPVISNARGFFNRGL